jgi:altronate hydrolase
MARQTPDVLCLHAEDNVLVALDHLQPGTRLEVYRLDAADPIPAGHKVACRDIGRGEAVRKYGQIIGFASRDIRPGQHVHTHNVEMGNFSRDYAIGADARSTPFLPEARRVTFDGILREDGGVGTRNYIGILASVNCSASVSHFVADAVSQDLLNRFPNVDGAVALGHGTGCGMAGAGEGFRLLQRTLAGYIRHPNFAGILLVGLGCEVNQVDCLMENMQLQAGPRLQTINIQDAGGTREAVGRGLQAIQEMLPRADGAGRSPVPASRLVLGLECGGSDAYSGISANPALGVAVDLLICHGGTAILSETPELYGAEHLLTRRASDRQVGEKLIQHIRWWRTTRRAGGPRSTTIPLRGTRPAG